MAEDVDIEKLVATFTDQYTDMIEEYMEKMFWSSFQKMLHGTKIFKGTVQKYNNEELIKPCFFIFVLICDISGGRHALEGTPFLPVFDKAVPKKLHIPQSVYDEWTKVAMDFFEFPMMSGLNKPRIYGLYATIYMFFDRTFKATPNEKKLVLDAADNMANSIYVNSILKAKTVK